MGSPSLSHRTADLRFPSRVLRPQIVMKRPNILLITWHDLGDWLRCYGHDDVESPCLDRLAEEGTLFERYFSTAPQCSPSRASLVTGRMPHWTGVLGLTHRGFDMRRDQTTMAMLLREAGYSTHLVGLQHECGDARWEGYDEVLSGKPDQPMSARGDAQSTADQAEKFFRRHARTTGRPFFLAIGVRDVHRPLGDTYEGDAPGRVKLPAYLPDCDAARIDMAVFYYRIKQADWQMGRIFDALDRHHLAEDTLVLFTTDHGAPIPRAKTTMYDPGLKTALLMRWPGRVPAGRRTDALLSNVDLLPTVLELADVEAPENLHGRSFAGVVTGQEGEGREAVFAEMTWHTYYCPLRAIRTKTHKYILNYRPYYPMVVEAGAISRYGSEIIERHYAAPLPVEELYDLENDPNELCNLADDKTYAALQARLRAKLLDMMERIDDPILNGPVPNPKPETTTPDFWVEQDGRFRLRQPGPWVGIEP